MVSFHVGVFNHSLCQFFVDISCVVDLLNDQPSSFFTVTANLRKEIVVLVTRSLCGTTDFPCEIGSDGKDIYLFISFPYHIGYNIQKRDIWYDIISGPFLRYKIWHYISVWKKIHIHIYIFHNTGHICQQRLFVSIMDETRSHFFQWELKQSLFNIFQKSKLICHFNCVM